MFLPPSPPPTQQESSKPVHGIDEVEVFDVDVTCSLFFVSSVKCRRYYMDKYNLEGQVLPHTAILDPRTGAQLLKVEGFVEPEDLSMALVEFLENNSIDQVCLCSFLQV